MKKALYKVKVEDGSIYIWQFIEFHNENDYGTGNYISVVCENERVAHLDMRYNRTYVFKSVCENYIKLYYGENLFSYNEI